jgi:hypothetical protein
MASKSSKSLFATLSLLLALSFGTFGPVFASAVPSPNSKSEASLNELPVEIHDGYLIIGEGSIAGAHGLRFLIDTGTSITTIDRRVAKRLGLAGHRTKVQNFDKQVDVEYTEVGEISFGPDYAFGVPVMIEDLKYLHAGRASVDGIIGLDLLRQQSFLVDYVGSRIIFGPVDTTGMHSAPMRTERTTLSVDAELDGRQVRMIADTGVLRTILYEQGPEAILANYKSQGRLAAQSLGGNVDARLASVLRLRLGGQSLDTQVLLVPPPNGNANSATSGFAGYLGPGSLNAKQLFFDFSAGQLYWK